MASGSTLADALVHRVASISDLQTRVGLVRTLLPGLDPDELRDALREITERAGMRDSAAQVTLLAMVVAMGGDPSAAGDKRSGGNAEQPDDDAPTGADWGLGRPLTLGERKSLARRPERRLLDRALRDGHPDVIAHVLVNPRVTEGDIARMCSSPHTRPAVLAQVFAAPRWTARARVRRAIAANPRTPVEIALALVPLLAREELREIAADTRLANAVRARALEVLRRLPPTPQGPAQPH